MTVLLSAGTAKELLACIPSNSFDAPFRTPKIVFVRLIIQAVFAKREKIVVFSSSLDALEDVSTLLEQVRYLW